MSEYTIKLKTLLDTDFIPNLNDYPIFDEAYRSVLNNKILDHFLYDEIGLETPDIFNHYLKIRMNEIMPYYNEIYRVQSLIVNPFYNFDYKETSERKLDSISTQNTSGETIDSSSQNSITDISKGKVQSHSAQSDTPQGNMTPYNVANGGYASLVNMSETEAAPDKTTANQSLSGTVRNDVDLTANIKNTDDYIRTITGTQGVNKLEILSLYKSVYVNIDLNIINSLKDLFMIVY